MGKRSAKGSGKARRRPERGGVSRASGGRGYRGPARGEAAANVLRTLPATDELENVPAFGDLRADEAQLAAFAEARGRVAERLGEEYARTLDLGCVVRLDRGFPLVACEERTLRAEHSVDFAKGAAAEAGIMPTVGDWVAVAVPPDHDMGVIEEVLPRRSAFARWRGGRRGEFQTLAANLDEVIVVAALGEGQVPLDRIARSLVLVRDCGASCSVVLTKADRKEREGDLDADVSRVRRHLRRPRAQEPAARGARARACACISRGGGACAGVPLPRLYALGRAGVCRACHAGGGRARCRAD